MQNSGGCRTGQLPGLGTDNKIVDCQSALYNQTGTLAEWSIGIPIMKETHAKGPFLSADKKHVTYITRLFNNNH